MAAPKPTGKDGQTTTTLDRLVYAEARARGLSMHRAAQAAGSKARTMQSLCHAATRLESEPEVVEAIATAKAAIKAQTDRAWERSLEVMAEDLESASPKARRGAAEFFGKVGGRFIQKHELAGPDGGALVVKFFTNLGEGEA